MTVELRVRDVRDEIYRVAGGPRGAGGGEPSTALLGSLFHAVFADLVGPDPSLSAQHILDETEPALDARRSALIHHAYRRSVGPRFRRHRAVLHDLAEQVPGFWQAVRELCGWLAELHQTVSERETTRAGQPSPSTRISSLFSVEENLEWELREPRWTDSVRLTGVADSVLRVPGTGRWCVVELKLGRTSPEADLAQVCLYHQMLVSLNRKPLGTLSGSAGAGGTIALMSFEPGRQERLFDARGLEEVRCRLMDLIGRMASVLPGRQPVPVEPPPELTDPEHVDLGRRLVETLREYGARVALDGPPRAGPAFLRYRVTLGPGVKLAAVKARANEMRIRLGLEAPPRVGIEGGRVVIDVQRPDRRIVRFSEIRPQIPPGDPLRGGSLVVLGVDLDSRLRFANFAQPENAHLLVAGTTGSGKSEWLRVAVAGLLATNSPQTLRLLLIDPKRNAFAMLRDSPFLFAPIVYPDEQPGAEVLKTLADEMDARYQRMSRTGADSWAEHVGRQGKPEPRIVCVCDEYSDLVMQDKDERKMLEQQIFRLGAKARAAGIHLILATQQPSREIIKGALDANIPARVGLRMEKTIESRMLLGTPGAESLLGQGDLLFKDIGDPVRLQSAYLPPEERERAFGSLSSVQ